MKTEAEILQLFAENQELMRVLGIIRDLKLKDSWLCAGSLRNFLWNSLSGYPPFDQETDLDVIFFVPIFSQQKTMELEQQLKQEFATYRWELRNQVVMHEHSPHTKPYLSSRDAMSKFPERCTAVGLRLLDDDRLEGFAPYGWQDILDFQVRPTPHFLADEERQQLYCQRLDQKNWQAKWPQLELYFPRKKEK